MSKIELRNTAMENLSQEKSRSSSMLKWIAVPFLLFAALLLVILTLEGSNKIKYLSLVHKGALIVVEADTGRGKTRQVLDVDSHFSVGRVAQDSAYSAFMDNNLNFSYDYVGRTRRPNVDHRIYDDVYVFYVYLHPNDTDYNWSSNPLVIPCVYSGVPLTVVDDTTCTIRIGPRSMTALYR